MINTGAGGIDGVGTPAAAYFEPNREANAQHVADIQRLIGGITGANTLAG